jgi:hypothetical protein
MELGLPITRIHLYHRERMMILLKMVKAKGKRAANTAPAMVRKDTVPLTKGVGDEITKDEEEEITRSQEQSHERNSHTNHDYTKRFQAKMRVN